LVEEFRKKSSERGVWITPTKSEDYTISKVDDYGSKGSIMGWISEIGRLP
jgi:hypothetical protein